MRSKRQEGCVLGSPEGRSGRSLKTFACVGPYQGGSKAPKKDGLFGNYLQEMLGAPRRSLLVSV
jgi:hypothetical protein